MPIQGCFAQLLKPIKKLLHFAGNFILGQFSTFNCQNECMFQTIVHETANFTTVHNYDEQ